MDRTKVEKYQPHDLSANGKQATNVESAKNRQEENVIKKKKDKAKPTTVFVKFASSLGSEMNILGYLQLRLPSDMEFSLEDRVTDEKTQSTVCTLKCSGTRMATRLKYKLHKGNAKSETKVWCFDDMEEAFGNEIDKSQDNEKLFSEFVEQIIQRAEIVLSDHDKKINTFESQIAEIQNKNQKFMSIEEFQLNDNQRSAIVDKVEELSKQRLEFQNFLKDVHKKLVDIKDSKQFTKISTKVRLDFAVECTRLSSALPIYARRSDIVQLVKENQVCVIIGETGSGKSTQMAQYLYQTGLANDGLIACTQPRKIAATSLATHVAKEMGTSVGLLVGYKVGMQTRKTGATKIVYMTDHVLLNECLGDRKLAAFSCIIIDEAHERSIYTDLLLGMIKECLPLRPDLRLIITSATIDPEVFVKYFQQCPVLLVSGRTFPVEVEWKNVNPEIDSSGSYEDDAVKKAVDVHQTQPDGDVLVFLTSPLETERCCEKFKSLVKDGKDDYACFQLHGKIQPDEQQKVFDPLNKGKRKIVFATNSAETSVTIPGIKYVIDTGFVKEMQFDANRKTNTLAIKMVTQSSAEQRKGRAGRTGPGKCFRLYTEEDYNEMQPNSIPEILKVHIGHAMLKLMELDIDPMEFDFVMSPSKESMKAAITSLENVGAVTNNRITALGKWIAKLPLDPKYSTFVHHALDKGVGLEAIVVAAMSGVGTLFYRAGTNEEKLLADKKKVQFCNEGGDHLTMLNVFKAWYKLPEKEKGKWCFENSINGKAIKGARETINEVLHILKKDMKTEIRFTFSPDKDVDEILKNLLLRTMKENLTYYLGHPKAGYHLLNKDQRVVIHPSSALVSLGAQPEWIVFDQIMKTSKDFAMTVTMVSEESVMEGAKSGWLTVNTNNAKEKRVILICNQLCGSQTFREFVGPRFVRLREFEIDLAKRFPKTIVIVDANRDTSEIKILSSEENKSALQDGLKTVLKPIMEKFQAEENEEPLGSKATANVRTVIGSGGCTKTLYMPDEYRKVKIFCSKELTDEQVETQFSKFGDIEECTKYNIKQKSNIWGHVIYFKIDSAVKAVDETNGVQDIFAKRYDTGQLKVEGLDTKIRWCRRPSRGFGFVELVEKADTLRIVALQNFRVCGSQPRIKPAKDSENTVHISGFDKSVTEDDLRQAVAEALHINAKLAIKKVNIVRIKTSTSAEDLAVYKEEFKRKISNYATPGKFDIKILEPKEFDINFTGFCKFENIEEGNATCLAINRGFLLKGEQVSMTTDLHCSIYIHKAIFDQSSAEVEACIKEMEDQGKLVKSKMKRLKTETVLVELRAEKTEDLADARRTIQNVINGEVIECDDIQMARSVFSRNGKTEMDKIMKETETLIIMDYRTMKISIHGINTNREMAKKQIRDFFQQLEQGNTKELQLKGNGKPPGVLKSLLQKFGIDLDGIRSKSNLSAIRLEHKYQRLILVGSDDAIAKACTLVNEVMEGLSFEQGTNKDDNPECVICFTPIEANDIYILECCGHTYCKDCVQLQLESDITSKTFPIKCGREDCNVPFCRRDFLNLSRLGLMDTGKLSTSSVSTFVSQHKKEFRYCITPDCPVVYKTTESAIPFLCSECSTKICTSCHVQYHKGLPCAFNADDKSLRVWMLQDEETRKFCPNCQTAIEKIGGCQRMTCTGCQKHVCWTCLAFFDTSSDCYDHLSATHGGFY